MARPKTASENIKPARRAKSGQGSFFKRGNKWVGEISLGKDSAGKRRRLTFYGDTLQSVQDQVNAARQADKAGTLPHDGTLTVSQLTTEWLTDKKEATRPNTYRQYEWIARAHIIPELGNTKVVELTVRQIEKFLQLKRRSLSATTVGHIYSVLHNAIENAVRWELAPRNIVAHARQPGGGDTPKEEIDFSPELAQRLLTAFAAHRHGALFTVLVGMGLRISEALGLSWDDVHLDDSRGPWLRVRQQLLHIDAQYQLTEPKSKSSKRNISIPGVVMAALRQHQRTQVAIAEPRAGLTWENKWNLVFTNENGGPLDVSRVRKHWVKMLTDAGVERMRLHDCRHLCATLLISQGIHPRMVMAILGHTQISLSMDRYGHVVTTETKGAADALDAVLYTASTQTESEDIIVG